MQRILLPLVLGLAASAAFAQGGLQERVRPITAPVRDAGTYHLAQGTWTRNTQNLVGQADVIYDNTCFVGGNFGAVEADETWTDEGRVPSPTTPDTATTKPGCALAYQVTGFQLGYCTETTSTAIDVTFREAYEPCGALGDHPVTAAFQLTGLPSAPSAGVQSCWLVAIDLGGTPTTPDRSFVLAADGGSLGQPPTTFGWSFAMPTVAPWLEGGVLLAGSPNTCSFWDGTIWDPAPANEPGTGMGTLDQFRSDGSATIPAGCYWFQSNPFASFHLELYSDRACAGAPGLDFCAGDGSATACPCANDSPAGSGTGCLNSAAKGASLDSLGTPSVGADSLALRVSNLPPTTVVLFLQAAGQVNGGAGAVLGDGLTCIAGSSLRLSTKFGENGAAYFPEPGQPKISSVGSVPVTGATLHYQAIYRDPAAFCTAATFNLSNGHSVVWAP